MVGPPLPVEEALAAIDASSGAHVAEPDEPPQSETHAGPAPKRVRGSRGAYVPWKREQEERARQEAAAPSLETGIAGMLQSTEGIQLLTRALEAEAARASFAEFFRQAWKVIEPSTDLVWNWHITLICTVAQAVFMDWLRGKKDKKYRNKIRNVIFNVPPGSSKSRLLSVCFQAFCWIHWPGMKFIALSVNDDAAMRDARAARDLVRSKWYQESFSPEWTVKGDQDAVSNYGNTESGERLSMAMKSEIVGLRGDCILIDDANNPKKSESKDERDTINDLWDTNQYNRVNDPMRSLRFGVQQRTHAADWTGHVIDLQGTWSPQNPNGWLHVVLPAEYDPARKFVLPEHLAAIIREHLPDSELLTEDPRVEKGETIDQERFPREFLEGERERWRGTGNYAGQMDQQPALAEGEKVQRAWFNFFRLAGGVRDDIDELDTGQPRPAQCHEGPAQVVHGAKLRPGAWDFDWITISIDPAAKKTEHGSNWGVLVIAGKGGRRFVLDDRTRRGAFHEIIDLIKELIKLWHPDTILVEPKAAGPDIMDTLKEQMAAGDVEMIAIEECDPGDADKERRLEAALPYIKNGMVFLLDGAPWLAEFVLELAQFPNGVHSDRVDALSQCLNWKRPAADSDWNLMSA